MTLHLVKLCVGASSIEDLAAWQAANRKRRLHNGKSCVFHPTFQAPKKQDELLDGGSLYWVMKGTILVRQELIGFEAGVKDDGSPCCHLLISPTLIPVRPTPRRAFQGWRYLEADEAPADLKRGSKNDITAMPAEMRKKLAELGLV